MNMMEERSRKRRSERHSHLLDVSCKHRQSMAVAGQGPRREAQKGGVPDSQDPQDQSQVVPRVLRLVQVAEEVAIQLVSTLQKFLENLKTVLETQRYCTHSTAKKNFQITLMGKKRRRLEAPSPPDAVTTADPIPETKHVCRVDSEFLHLLGIRAAGDDVTRHDFLGRILAVGDELLETVEKPLPHCTGVQHRL